jgi:hypothetical protein
MQTQSEATCSRWFLARDFFYPEVGGDTFLRNVGSHNIYMEPHPRRRNSSYYTDICLELSNKTTKNFNQDGNCPGQDSNREPQE